MGKKKPEYFDNNDAGILILLLSNCGLGAIGATMIFEQFPSIGIIAFIIWISGWLLITTIVEMME